MEGERRREMKREEEIMEGTIEAISMHVFILEANLIFCLWFC